jgi:hypothetical protein
MRAWLCLSMILGVLFQATPANAHPVGELPEISGGTVPYKVFSGYASLGVTPLLTVPDDQDFILTGVSNQVSGAGGFSGSNGFEFQSDGVRILGGTFISAFPHTTFGQNEGRLRIEAGRALTLSYSGGSPTAAYFVQGYFVAAGSPYRSTIGTIWAPATDGTTTIFTAEPSRTFIIRSLILYCQGGPANILVDGVLAIPRHVDAATISSNPSLFAIGKGALPVPPGTTVALAGESFTGSCDYYLDGKYVQP